MKKKTCQINTIWKKNSEKETKTIESCEEEEENEKAQNHHHHHAHIRISTECGKKIVSIACSLC